MRTRGKSVEVEDFQRAFGKRLTLELREEVRPAAPAKSKKYITDPEVNETICLVITEADVLKYPGIITEEMVGLFWFVPGYSDPDGPDIIRPDA